MVTLSKDTLLLTVRRDCICRIPTSDDKKASGESCQTREQSRNLGCAVGGQVNECSCRWQRRRRRRRLSILGRGSSKTENPQRVDRRCLEGGYCFRLRLAQA